MSEATVDLQGAWVHEIAWTGGDLCVRLSRRLGDPRHWSAAAWDGQRAYILGGFTIRVRGR